MAFAVTAAAIATASEQLKSMGIDHIITPDGRFVVEADREFSRQWIAKQRKSPEYQKYLALVKKLKAKGKFGIEGGYGVKKVDGEYKAYKLSKDQITKLKHRRNGQHMSSRMAGNGGSEGKKELKPAAKKPVGKSAGKPALKPALKKAGAVRTALKPAAKKPVRRSARD